MILLPGFMLHVRVIIPRHAPVNNVRLSFEPWIKWIRFLIPLGVKSPNTIEKGFQQVLTTLRDFSDLWLVDQRSGKLHDLIVSPNHEAVLPDVPPGNVRALAEAAVEDMD